MQRLQTGPANSVVEHILDRETRSWGRLWPHYVAIQRSHLAVLLEAGFLSPADAAALFDAIAGIEVPKDRAGAAGTADLYFLMEKAITERAGADRGGRLHIGRSRNDLNATAVRMIAREEILEAFRGTLALQRTLLRLAEEHAGTVMPGLTHRQPAQPITYGFWLLCLASAADRDLDRLRDAYRRTNLCAMGAAAFSGTRGEIDRARMAGLLGFDGPVENALDAVAARDFLMDAVFAFAVQCQTIGRASNDLIMWNNSIVGAMEVGDPYAGISSIMPQKKNPLALEHCRARAGSISGVLFSLFGIARGTFLEHARDSSDMTGPFLAACEDARGVRRMFDESIASLRLFPDRLERYAAAGFSTVTDLADWLAIDQGWSFRTAHDLISRAVVIELEGDPGATTLSRASLDAAGRNGRKIAIADGTLSELLDPRQSIAARCNRGSTAPQAVREAAGIFEERLKAWEAWESATLVQLRRADEELKSVAGRPS